MKWPAYPKYKDSDIDWLEKVPVEWDVVSVRNLFELGRGRVISNEEIGQNPGAYPVFSSQTENDGILGTISTYDYEGDYLTWTTDGANAGTVFCRHGRFNCTNVCGTMKGKGIQIDIEFFCNLLNVFVKRYVRQDINPKLMNNVMAGIRILYPPLPIQEEIRKHLNHQLLKFDNLITEQEKLIALLQEKRQAVISHAVTKGLNPDAPMKDSGVEWLGKIPEGWIVAFFKQVISVIESGTSVNAVDESTSDEEFGILKTSCVYERNFRADKNKTVLREEYQRLSCPLQRGCLIVSRMNTPELVGAAGVVEEEHNNIFLPDRLWQIHAIGIDIHYLWYWTQSTFYMLQIKQSCNGTSSSMQNLAQDQFRNILVSQPSITEQKTIVEFLKKETTKIDNMIIQSRKAIELLYERRTALISAAVTGKIDVRGLTASEPA